MLPLDWRHPARASRPLDRQASSSCGAAVFENAMACVKCMERACYRTTRFEGFGPALVSALGQPECMPRVGDQTASFLPLSALASRR